MIVGRDINGEVTGKKGHHQDPSTIEATVDGAMTNGTGDLLHALC